METGTAVAQLVQWLVKGWVIEVSEFQWRYGKGIHPASYPLDIGGSYFGSKAEGA
jgi:hypothetical protein